MHNKPLTKVASLSYSPFLSRKHARAYSTSSLRHGPHNDTLMRRVRRLANLPRTGVSLQQLLKYGYEIDDAKLIQSANFLHHELAVRYSHRMKNLDDLPHGLSDMPSVRQVREWYLYSIEELLAFPKIKCIEQESRFTELIESIKRRHNSTLFTMARGVHELKMKYCQESKSCVANSGALRFMEFADLSDLHSFLDAFYMSRIGIRMLMSQHIALHEQVQGWVGCICESTSPAEVALSAIDTAKLMCIRQYGDAPEVEMHGQTDFAMPFVPSHLHHMLFEVIKNSMRAVAEFHGIDNEMPPIKVIIADGEDNEDVCIKVSDEGGGIPRSCIPRIWSYLYTTADTKVFERITAPADFGGDSPLAGLGYGLPISRLFARYFGGDLQIISMEGYGTDAYLHLKRVGDASEPLP